MKYKNYKNPHTRDDKIYSRDNMLDMTLRELLNSKNELLAQTRILGIPEDRELSGSENVVHVEAYTREDGTEVKAHWRSKPSGWNSVTNNSSVIDSEGTFINDEDAGRNENSNNAEQYRESEEYKRVYREREKQKSIERKDPKEIAGVKKGEPKTFYEMMQQGVNPNYQSKEDSNGQYSTNCQSCNVACELIMRGYNVEAESYENPVTHELAKIDNSAYLDPITGEKCVPVKIDLEKFDCTDYIDKTVKVEERYEFSYNITPDKDDYSSTEAHTVIMTRMNNGELLIYDGQNGNVAYGEKETKSYIDSIVNDDNTIFFPRILRVDDKKVNPYYTDKVVRASGKSRKY